MSWEINRTLELRSGQSSARAKFDSPLAASYTYAKGKVASLFHWSRINIATGERGRERETTNKKQLPL